MPNLNKLTAEEQKELARLMKKATQKNEVETNEEYTPEEEEVIQFFMDLIPILQEAAIDLEKKGLLNRKDFKTNE